MVRAKFIVKQKTENQSGFSIQLEPVQSGSEENKQFFHFTPWGKIEMGTINENVVNEFIIGKEYYVDFTLCPDLKK